MNSKPCCSLISVSINLFCPLRLSFNKIRPWYRWRSRKRRKKETGERTDLRIIKMSKWKTKDQKSERKKRQRMATDWMNYLMEPPSLSQWQAFLIGVLLNQIRAPLHRCSHPNSLLIKQIQSLIYLIIISYMDIFFVFWIRLKIVKWKW